MANALFGANRMKIVVKAVSVGARIDPNIQEIIYSEFESKLARIQKFEFIDRSQVKSILEEKALEESGIACEDDKCNIKFAIKIKAQVAVSAKLYRLSDTYYKLSAKFLNVEKGTPDIIDAKIDRLDDIDKAVEKVCLEYAERVPRYGEVIKRDGARVFVNLGTDDNLMEDQEVEVIRLDAVINEATDELAGYIEESIAKGKLVKMSGNLSQIYFTDKKKKQEEVAEKVKLLDRVVLVVSEDGKRRFADKYYSEAKVFLKNNNFEEAKNSIDKALGFLPKNADFQKFRSTLLNKIDEENVKMADQREKERIKREAEERRKKESFARSSSSSSRSYSSSSSSSSSSRFRLGSGSASDAVKKAGFLGGYNYLITQKETDFGKFFKGMGGLNAGLISPKDVFFLIGSAYFFQNDADPSMSTYKSVKAFMFDLHGILNVSLPVGPFVPHAGIGLFYRYFTLRIEDPSIPLESRVFESPHWGLGWEPVVGLTIYFGSSLGLDIRFSYQSILANTFELDFSSSTSTAVKDRTEALNDLKSPVRDYRLGIGGFNLSADIVVRL
jgi:tetratricopeptide (TPR) repeat protein